MKDRKASFSLSDVGGDQRSSRDDKKHQKTKTRENV